MFKKTNAMKATFHTKVFFSSVILVLITITSLFGQKQVTNFDSVGADSTFNTLICVFNGKAYFLNNENAVLSFNENTNKYDSLNVVPYLGGLESYYYLDSSIIFVGKVGIYKYLILKNEFEEVLKTNQSGRYFVSDKKLYFEPFQGLKSFYFVNIKERKLELLCSNCDVIRVKDEFALLEIGEDFNTYKKLIFYTKERFEKAIDFQVPKIDVSYLSTFKIDSNLVIFDSFKKISYLIREKTFDVLTFDFTNSVSFLSVFYDEEKSIKLLAKTPINDGNSSGTSLKVYVLRSNNWVLENSTPIEKSTQYSYSYTGAPVNNSNFYVANLNYYVVTREGTLGSEKLFLTEISKATFKQTHYFLPSNFFYDQKRVFADDNGDIVIYGNETFVFKNGEIIKLNSSQVAFVNPDYNFKDANYLLTYLYFVDLKKGNARPLPKYFREYTNTYLYKIWEGKKDFLFRKTTNGNVELFHFDGVNVLQIKHDSISSENTYVELAYNNSEDSKNIILKTSSNSNNRIFTYDVENKKIDLIYRDYSYFYSLIIKPKIGFSFTTNSKSFFYSFKTQKLIDLTNLGGFSNSSLVYKFENGSTLFRAGDGFFAINENGIITFRIKVSGLFEEEIQEISNQKYYYFKSEKGLYRLGEQGEVITIFEHNKSHYFSFERYRLSEFESIFIDGVNIYYLNYLTHNLQLIKPSGAVRGISYKNDDVIILFNSGKIVAYNLLSKKEKVLKDVSNKNLENITYSSNEPGTMVCQFRYYNDITEVYSVTTEMAQMIFSAKNENLYVSSFYEKNNRTVFFYKEGEETNFLDSKSLEKFKVRLPQTAEYYTKFSNILNDKFWLFAMYSNLNTANFGSSVFIGFKVLDVERRQFLDEIIYALPQNLSENIAVSIYWDPYKGLEPILYEISDSITFKKFDLVSGILSSEPNSFFAIGNEIFCFAKNSRQVPQIWKLSSFKEFISDKDSLVLSNEKTTAEILLYPNPNDGFVKFKGNTLEIMEVKVIDSKGVVVKIENMKNKDVLNISSLSSGTYFIEMNTNKGTITKRLLKIN